MKVVLSIMVALVMAISPVQSLLATGNHDLMHGKVVQQGAILDNLAGKVDVACNEHNSHKQAECDSLQCASASSVIFQAAGKLVAHNATSSFLLKNDRAFAKDNLSSLFRPPRV